MSNYQTNGVSHLFSISGMHISLLAGIIIFILNKLSYHIKLNYFIVIAFLIFYLFLTRLSPSILRATIMFILLGINKCFNFKMKSIDIMILVLIIAIIINPFYIYNVGFQFSYLISLTLILFTNKINKINNKILKSLYVSYLSFLVSFPIAVYNFYQVNFLSIFLNIILIPLVSIIIYPLSLLVFIFPILNNIFNITINILEYINNLASNITLFQTIFSKPSLIIIIIYYFIIYLTLYNKKFLIIFIIILSIHKFYPYLNNKFYFITIDVGQGDSLFIKFPHNKGNILIDTGGLTTYETEEWATRTSNYSIVESKTIPYLKSIGINTIDYLILTHGDNDHMGEATNLINNFKVDSVIFNNGEYNESELELINILNNKKISYHQNINKLNIEENIIYFLNNKIYDNENDNSIVLYLKINNYKLLLMGDASTEVEKNIVKKYNIKNIDILKVGHHGSKTSSSEEFINFINPKYSIISVGENNKYGHPNKEVLEVLKNSTIYRTDKYGSIMFKINKNKLELETFPP